MLLLCVPGRHALFSKELALEFVHVLLGFVDVLVEGDSGKVLLKILLFVNRALAAVALPLCVQTLHHHLLLLLVLILILLPAVCTLQIPHLRVIVLDPSELLFICRAFFIHLATPVLALVLLD
jgi:hypothetical protein